MKRIAFLWTAALAVLFSSCKEPDGAARLTSLRGTVEALVQAEVQSLEREKDGLRYEVSKRGNQPGHLALVERAARTYQATLGVLKRLDSLQEAFIAGAGPATGAASHPDYTHRFFPAREYGGALTGLEGELQGFISNLNPGVVSRADGLVGPEGALARLREGETSLAEALSLLWEMELATVECASNGLDALLLSLPDREEVLPYPVVDLPAELPEGDSLRVGIVLRGMIPRTPAGALEMTCNGKPIAVEQGIGKVRFIAQGPPGTKHWEAAIRVNLFERDTVFRATQTYRVLPQ